MSPHEPNISCNANFPPVIAYCADRFSDASILGRLILLQSAYFSLERTFFSCQGCDGSYRARRLRSRPALGHFSAA